MTTPFAVTTLFILTVLDNSGRLAPVDKSELPTPLTTPISFSEDSCMVTRGKMAHPERYVCQRWTGEAISRFSFGTVGEAPQPAAKEPDPPTAPPKADPPKPDPASALPPITYRLGQACHVGWTQKQYTAYRLCSGSACGPDEVQIDGKQYTGVAGLAWTPVTEVPTASREDQPAPPPKQRVARQPQPQDNTRKLVNGGPAEPNTAGPFQNPFGYGIGPLKKTAAGAYRSALVHL
jgi:hypothetical protein